MVTDAEYRILAVIRQIPRGSVMSYGRVAALAGLVGRARMVACILSNNTDPDLPWHRVLRADGRIALPLDSPGFNEQKTRLQAEGVEIKGARVRMPEPDLDRLLWQDFER